MSAGSSVFAPLNDLLAATNQTSGVDRGAVLFVVMGSLSLIERSILQQQTWCQHATCVFSLLQDVKQAAGLAAAERVLKQVAMRTLKLDRSLVSGPSAKACCKADEAGKNESQERPSPLPRRLTAPRKQYLREFSKEGPQRYFCAKHAQATMTAQYRFLPALHWAREQLRTKRYDWVAIVDDDSFVFPRALQRLLQRYDSSRAYYFGDFLGDDALTFACGGAGSLLSRGAMARMNLIACIRTMHPKCMQSDWMIGKCAARAQVEPVTEHGCTCTGDGRGIREWMLRGSTPPLHLKAGFIHGSCHFLQKMGSPAKDAKVYRELNDLESTLLAARNIPAVVHGFGSRTLERLADSNANGQQWTEVVRSWGDRGS